MKLLTKNILALLAVSASLLTSCADDVMLNTEGEGNNGIILYIPELPDGATPPSGTRGDGQLAGFTRAETTVGKFRLFIYQVDAAGNVSQNPFKDYTLKKGGAAIQNITGYGAYQLEDIPTGNYKIYVTANVDIPATTTYSDLLKGDNKVGLLTDANLSGGLPMSCSHEDLLVDNNRIGNGYVTIQPGVTNMTIKANLKYAVSKVRFTILNDLRPKDEVTDVNVYGHIKSATVFPGVRKSKAEEDKEKAGANEAYNVKSWGKYYGLVNVDNKGIAATNVDALGNAITFNGSTPYTYQTVFYVPERLFQTQSDCTTAKIKIGSTEVTQKLGHDDGDGSGFALKRSNFYDYIGAPDGKFYLQVQKWELETIVGALGGVYWLNVDQTKFIIESGKETELRVSSNALNVVPSCQKFKIGNTEYPIYTFSENNGVLTVTLNKDLDRNTFNAIKASGDWKYITLTAGTLIKKIEIDDIKYSEYINEDTMVTIDVSERKTSGDYSNSIPVKLTTNLKYIRFEKVNWPASADAGTPSSLFLQDKNGNPLSVNQKIKVPENGEVDFRIAYTGLNSDRSLWQDDHNFEVLVKGVDENGNILTNNGEEIKCTVGIYVRTSYDVYRIHLKAPSWSHPHIYVYQCLQLPGEFDESRNGAKAKQTVGYVDGNSYAALEYDFTGAVAFKGWFVDSNNDPYAAGFHRDFFFMFNNNYSSESDNWSPALTYNKGPNNAVENLALKNELHYKRMDFASEHRKKLKENNTCAACTASPIPTAWPGIHMIKDPTKPENSGWWYFELTGVADPGKALIMFTDCGANTHNYDGNMENNRRYPKAEEPGVALFDNSAKEGWFVFTDSNTPTSFQSVDPDN